MTIRFFNSLVKPTGYAGLPVSGANEAQKPSAEGQPTMCDFTGKDVFSRAGKDPAAPNMSQTAEIPTPSVSYASADEFLRARGIKTV